MDILDAIHLMFSLVLVALTFACVVPDNLREKNSGNPNATGTAHDTCPETATPVAAMSARRKPSGDLNATGTAHHTSLEITTSMRKKPNIWKWLWNSTGCAIGLVAIISAFPILYFLAFLWDYFGHQFVFLLMVLLCGLFIGVGYFFLIICYIGISAVYCSVAMLILKIMNKRIPSETILRTAVYVSIPMIAFNTFTILMYSSYKYIYISIPITAGLMFLAIRHILKEQESECMYISAAIRQHIRQHGFIHAAF